MVFSLLFGLSLFAEVLANDKPLLVQYQGELFTPFLQFYPETAFGGDFQTEAVYRDVEVQCLIVAGGSRGLLGRSRRHHGRGARTARCWAKPVQRGWIIWPLIPYSFNTVNDIGGTAPSAAGCAALAGHRRHRARRAGAGDLRLPPVGGLCADRDVPDLGDRHRGGGGAGLFRRADRSGLPAPDRALGRQRRAFTSSSSSPRSGR